MVLSCRHNSVYSSNTSLLNLSPTNLFAYKDRVEPDSSVGHVRRDLIGQPDRDGPGLGLQDRPEEEKRKNSDSMLAFSLKQF